jgi:phosphohistidine phosphatase
VKLLVFRHGPAGDSDAWKAEGRDDRLRPLTSQGKKDTRQAAAGVATLLSGMDIIISSPLVRATQTADILAREYDCEIITRDTLLPDSDLEESVTSLQERSKDQVVAIVGHEPHLSRFISYLMSGQRTSFVDLKKAGACLLELETIGAASATLKWLLTRRELARLSQ